MIVKKQSGNQCVLSGFASTRPNRPARRKGSVDEHGAPGKHSLLRSTQEMNKRAVKR
jgi:hypothetical protein